MQKFTGINTYFKRSSNSVASLESTAVAENEIKHLIAECLKKNKMKTALNKRYTGIGLASVESTVRVVQLKEMDTIHGSNHPNNCADQFTAKNASSTSASQSSFFRNTCRQAKMSEDYEPRSRATEDHFRPLSARIGGPTKVSASNEKRSNSTQWKSQRKSKVGFPRHSLGPKSTAAIHLNLPGSKHRLSRQFNKIQPIFNPDFETESNPQEQAKFETIRLQKLERQRSAEHIRTFKQLMLEEEKRIKVVQAKFAQEVSSKDITYSETGDIIEIRGKKPASGSQKENLQRKPISYHSKINFKTTNDQSCQKDVPVYSVQFTKNAAQRGISGNTDSHFTLFEHLEHWSQKDLIMAGTQFKYKIIE